MVLRGKKSCETGEGGQVWVWTAVDAKTRLLMTFFVGDRKEESCKQFVSQVAHVIGEKSKPLFASDELPTYASALEKEFGKVIVPEHTGKQGRPRLPYSVPADDLDYVTVHKTREGGRVVKVEKRIVFGPDGHLKIPRLWPGQNPPATEL